MMENLASVLVSGTSVIAKECRKCGKKRARGVYIIREQDGRHIFKCDTCGQKASMGWTEASRSLMLEKKEGYANATANRDRWQREMEQKFNEDYSEALEEVETRPDAVENFEKMLEGPELSKDKVTGYDE